MRHSIGVAQLEADIRQVAIGGGEPTPVEPLPPIAAESSGKASTWRFQLGHSP